MAGHPRLAQLGTAEGRLVTTTSSAWYSARFTMREPRADQPAGEAELAPRLRRALQLVYAVDGVVAVRVWHWGPNVAVGVRGGAWASPTDLVRRVKAAVAGLREPGEAWDFGVLEDPTCWRPGETT
jgi:hypothetical protein